MKKILLIDDDVIIRLAFSRVLKRSDYMIQQARDVDEAIYYLKAEIFDLVLLDLKLPARGWDSGFYILRKKRDISLNAGTPVIIVSGAPSKEGVLNKTIIQDNVVEIFIKPIENTALTKKVAEIFEQKIEFGR